MKNLIHKFTKELADMDAAAHKSPHVESKDLQAIHALATTLCYLYKVKKYEKEYPEMDMDSDMPMMKSNPYK